jgi:hypothetical protein
MIHALKTLAAAVLLCLAHGAAKAEPVAFGPRQDALCAAAIRPAEVKYGVPPGLLLTIAKVESGRRAGDGSVQPWPWTINADGAGFYFSSKQEAVDWARQGLLRGVRFMDVGCGQIDLQMHPAAFRSLEDAFEPAFNADYAARFLRTLKDGPAGGNWYIAIGMYHSQTPDLAAGYRSMVAAVGLGLPPMAFGGPFAVRAGIVRIALSGGGSVKLNTHRRPARVHRKLTGCQINAVLGSYLRSPARCER